MNPNFLLALWRERWAKPSVTRLQVPYMDGPISQWGIRISQKINWSLPSIILYISIFTIFFLSVVVQTNFSLNNQITYSVFILVCALLVRPHAGVLPALILVGLSLIVSVRYFYWRFENTIGADEYIFFALGFILFLAELYLAFQAILSLIELRWPIKREQSNLRSDSNSWPNIDVFVFCANQDANVIESTLMMAKELDWPENKIKIILIDNSSESNNENIANKFNTQYFHCNEIIDVNLECMNQALIHTKGDFIFLLECNQPQDRMVLQRTVGWFLRNEKLGFLSSPNHFLAPKLSKQAFKIFTAIDLNSSIALMRRSMLLKIGDGIEKLLTTRERMFIDMQSLGYECSYMGHAHEAFPMHDEGLVDSVKKSHPSTHYFRVSHADLLSRLLSTRFELASLQIMLDFYRPLVFFILILGPLPYWFFNVKVIQGNLDIFGSVFLPHILHWYMAKGRMTGKRRVTLWIEFREAVLAIYLTFLTAISFIKTEFEQFAKHILKKENIKSQPFDWFIYFPFGIVISLTLTGLFTGIINFPLDRRYDWAINFFYLFWSLCSLLMLCALGAVAQETRHIRSFRRLQLSRVVMLELPLGRTLSCVTENFPEEPLMIQLPISINLVVGSTVNLSIFTGHREFGFSARVDSFSDKKLGARIHDSEHSDYLAFVEMVYSRGKNWPKWLPDRDADSPLPRWLYRAVDYTKQLFVNLRAKYKKILNLKINIFTEIKK